MAKPYYDRFAELFAAFGGYAKPWTDATADDTSFAVASTGQLKNVFAFDLNPDSDGEGIPDGQETGSSPWLADTDGDGFKDDEDRWPQGNSSVLAPVWQPDFPRWAACEPPAHHAFPS